MPKLAEDFNVRATLRGKKAGTMISPEASDPLLLYQLLHKVGEGSYGEIYKAMSKTQQQIVALKVIDLEKTEDDIEDLLIEVDFQAKCDSPYLAKYNGSWLWENKLSIAMEFLGGGTLEELVNNCKLTEAHCSFILREVLRSLYYLHKTMKIHRDIKPANVLFDNNSCVKLADFGVAAQMTSTKNYRETFVGTPLYLAPEIILSDKYGTKVDIWSLGVMGIEIATGIVPRRNQHPMDILYAIPKESPPHLPNTFSAEFRDFISKCCVKDPKRRSTAEELLRHPFILTADNFDKNILKKSLEYRLKTNTKKLENSKSVIDQDDWWAQYNKVAGLKKPSQQKPQSPSRHEKEPSAAAKASVRPEMGRINIHETYGKKHSYFRSTSQQMKPLYQDQQEIQNDSINSTIPKSNSSTSLKSSKSSQDFSKLDSAARENPLKQRSSSNLKNSVSSQDLSIIGTKSLFPDNVKSNSQSNLKAMLDSKPKNQTNIQSTERGRPESSQMQTSLSTLPKSLKKSNSSQINLDKKLSSSVTTVCDKTLILSEEFKLFLSKNLPKKLTTSRLSLLKFLEEIYDSENKFLLDIENCLDAFLNPLMSSLKGQVVKEDKVELMFKNLLKIHQCSLKLLQNFKSDLCSFETEGTLERGCIFFLENLSNEIQLFYGEYCGNMCKTFWEYYKMVSENAKFKEFLAEVETSTGCKLFDLISLPVNRLIQYGNICSAAKKSIVNPSSKILSVIKEILEFKTNFADAIENCEKLMELMVNVVDLPPAILLKPKQRVLLVDTVQKLKMGSSFTSTKVHGQGKLILLRDSLLILKFLNAKNEDNKLEPFSLRNLLDNGQAIKPSVKVLKYRNLIPFEFLKCEGHPDIVKEGSVIYKNVFSVTLNVKNGKTRYFSASSSKVMQEFSKKLQ
ncbi:hypothetical protein HDU92_002090 [Lobulomyces angularis]|nr:hypothetical protein HDU92_002090 [Lobulomyces angularis]